MRIFIISFVFLCVVSSFVFAQSPWDWSHDTYGWNVDSLKTKVYVSDTVSVFQVYGDSRLFPVSNDPDTLNFFMAQFVRNRVGNFHYLDSLVIPFRIISDTGAAYIAPEFGFNNSQKRISYNSPGLDESRRYGDYRIKSGDGGWHLFWYRWGAIPTTNDYDQEALQILMYPKDTSKASYVGVVMEMGTAISYYTTAGGKDSVVIESMNISAVAQGAPLPSKFHLYQNYPNPFNPVTSIEYQVARSMYVELVVYDMLGQKVETLVHGQESAGLHRVSFDASRMASGTYFYILRAGGNVITKKMVLLK